MCCIHWWVIQDQYLFISGAQYICLWKLFSWLYTMLNFYAHSPPLWRSQSDNLLLKVKETYEQLMISIENRWTCTVYKVLLYFTMYCSTFNLTCAGQSCSSVTKHVAVRFSELRRPLLVWSIYLSVFLLLLFFLHWCLTSYHYHLASYILYRFLRRCNAFTS